MTLLTIILCSAFFLSLLNRQFNFYKAVKGWYRFRKLIDKECYIKHNRQ